MFPSGFPINHTRISVLPVQATCPANLTVPNLVTRMAFQYMTKNHEALHYAVFSILLSLSPTCAQIPSAARCLQLPSGLPDSRLPLRSGRELCFSELLRKDSWPLKMGPISCPETPVRNDKYSLRNHPEESSFHPLVCAFPIMTKLHTPIKVR
jgi:hypothetical protein